MNTFQIDAYPSKQRPPEMIFRKVLVDQENNSPLNFPKSLQSSSESNCTGKISWGNVRNISIVALRTHFG